MALVSYTYMTIIFSVIAAVAFLGNVMMIYILVNKSSYLKQPYNIFILNLVITDLLTSIMLVFSRYVYLPPMPDGKLSQEIYCRSIWSPRILFTLGYISLYNCLALTVERWLAVVKPLLYSCVTPSHTIKAIAGVWTWGIVINIGSFFRKEMNSSKNACTGIPLPFADRELRYVDFALQSVIPLALIVGLYIHILHTIMVKLPNVGARSRIVKKITLFAFVASSVLIFGWIPGRIRLILMYSGVIEHNTHPLAQYCLATLAFSNSCINPFLYGICCAHVKKEYKEIFHKIFCRQRKNVGKTLAVENALPAAVLPHVVPRLSATEPQGVSRL